MLEAPPNATHSAENSMKERLKILLYGDTLVLAALQASLAAQPDLDVVGIIGMAASEQTLCALRPNVIIFDLGAVQPAFHYALVEKLPGLLLIGIDASTHRVLVWSGQQLYELSTIDLVEVIGRHTARGSGSGLAAVEDE